jgi:uncharacterized SAM-binding protein YcdF (DUF218 family)
VVSLLKGAILPPASLLLLIIAGICLRRRYPAAGQWLVASSLALLYLLATPVVSGVALHVLEPRYADPRDAGDAEAIIVLGGGSVGFAAEYGTDSVNPMTLVRLRYGAWLHRQTGKPLLVSGGGVKTLPEAVQMRSVLVEEMNVPVRWIERVSVNTYANALESRRLLAREGIDRIYLVTHAFHMPRARLAFEHAGFQVVPAPTAFTRFDWRDLELVHFLPRASAILNSYYFCHEVLGYAVYSLRMRFASTAAGERDECARQMG